jgi:hypothetical protein
VTLVKRGGVFATEYLIAQSSVGEGFMLVFLWLVSYVFPYSESCDSLSFILLLSILVTLKLNSFFR